MKLGIKREKIGDILVFEDGADIVCCNEISKYIYRLFTIVQSGQAKVAMTTGCNCCLKREKTVRNRGDSFDSEPFYGELPVLISRGQRSDDQIRPPAWRQPERPEHRR